MPPELPGHQRETAFVLADHVRGRDFDHTGAATAQETPGPRQREQQVDDQEGHAAANAEQVRLLKEALAETSVAGLEKRP